MSKKHDESKDVRLVSRIAKINFANKTIRVSKNQPIGIRTWGRIDFLTNYCGYVLVYDGSVPVTFITSSNNLDDSKTKKKQAKQDAKDKTLKNKKK